MKLNAVVCLSILFAAVASQAANSAEFTAMSKQATRNNETKEGRHYQDQVFLNAIDPALRAAMESCAKTAPNTIDGHPGEIIFVVAADGRVKKLLYSPDVPLAECVGAKLRAISKLPPPPHDSWAVGVGVAQHGGPPDKVRRLRGRDQLAAYEKATAPYVAKARATYPAAKKRFLAGLPPGHKFSVQVFLFDRDGKNENSFVDVEKIKDENITGVINSELGLVTDYKTGQ